jgi:hypothetical protein
MLLPSIKKLSVNLFQNMCDLFLASDTHDFSLALPLIQPQNNVVITEGGLTVFDARPCLPVFPELRRTGRFRLNGHRFRLNGQARSDTGSPVPAHSRPAYERAALLWHGKSL